MRLMVKYRVGDCLGSLVVNNAFLEYDDPLSRNVEIAVALIDRDLHEFCRKRYGRRASITIEDLLSQDSLGFYLQYAPQDLREALGLPIIRGEVGKRSPTLCGYPMTIVKDEGGVIMVKSGWHKRSLDRV